MMRCGFQAIDPTSGSSGTSGLIGEADSLVVSTLVGGDWQQKVRLSVLGLAAGDYRLVWSYNWNLGSTSKSFEARIQVNDTPPDLVSHLEEPTDATGNYESTGSGQKFLETGVRKVALSGDVDIDLDWRSPDNRVTASIWNARLELWRIS
jgi:hypothetical protein